MRRCLNRFRRPSSDRLTSALENRLRDRHASSWSRTRGRRGRRFDLRPRRRGEVTRLAVPENLRTSRRPDRQISAERQPPGSHDSRCVLDHHAERELAIRAEKGAQTFMETRSSTLQKLQTVFFCPSSDSAVPVPPAEDGRQNDRGPLGRGGRGQWYVLRIGTSGGITHITSITSKTRRNRATHQEAWGRRAGHLC